MISMIDFIHVFINTEALGKVYGQQIQEGLPELALIRIEEKIPPAEGLLSWSLKKSRGLNCQIKKSLL